MDRDRISAITHGDRAFHNPLDPARVAEALDTLVLGPGDRVLDAGCGAGELLVGLAERHGCGGLGVDTSEILTAQARRRADALFHDLWSNDDDQGYKAAMNLLDGRYTWLEEGVADPSDFR